MTITEKAIRAFEKYANAANENVISFDLDAPNNVGGTDSFEDYLKSRNYHFERYAVSCYPITTYLSGNWLQRKIKKVIGIPDDKHNGQTYLDVNDISNYYASTNEPLMQHSYKICLNLESLNRHMEICEKLGAY